MNPIITGLIGLLAGAGGVWVALRLRARDARATAQEQLAQTRAEFDRDAKERRQELTETERRLLQREANLDRKAETLDRKTDDVVRKELDMVGRERELHKLQGELDDLKRLSRQELQRIAGLSAEQAKTELLGQLESEVKADAAGLTRRLLDEARTNADREARRVLTIALERCASNHVQSATTCALALPTEEMKGRIIGREGRNIRAFEAATGVNVLIDDTPQTVVLSGFDPVRREVARLTLERLVADGRINPARIEEEVARVRAELDETLRQVGEDAAVRAGVPGLAPEVVKLLGRLRFRHSFAQNVLEHSVEVAHLAGMIAAEMGWDQALAKRCGLLHDIGKAVDHEVEGSHASIGAQLLKQHGEPAEVGDAVGSHHHERDPATLYGMLVSAADAVSASRPGARSESMELYLQRLEKLEAIANGFTGVDRSFALQAGREIRVLVQPEKVNDADAVLLARQITQKIEQELQYPGQIKVTVVRETRAVEFAK
jgi:ribonuclease Y